MTNTTYAIVVAYLRRHDGGGVAGGRWRRCWCLWRRCVNARNFRYRTDLFATETGCRFDVVSSAPSVVYWRRRRKSAFCAAFDRVLRSWSDILCANFQQHRKNALLCPTRTLCDDFAFCAPFLPLGNATENSAQRQAVMTSYWGWMIR